MPSLAQGFMNESGSIPGALRQAASRRRTHPGLLVAAKRQEVDCRADNLGIGPTHLKEGPKRILAPPMLGLPGREAESLISVRLQDRRRILVH